MSDRLLAATRKGVFSIERSPTGWKIARAAFLGDSSPMLMRDPRDGAMYVALGHGHFGSKLHRSLDDGETWQEIAAPKYPEKPAGEPDVLNPHTQKPIPWSLELIWALEPASPAEPGALWCGTIPGGLFRSPDRGESWELVRSLWDHPGRRKWFGGGFELPGIHSICVDPRDGRKLTVGVSCGGAWRSVDGGANWECCAAGMRAEYMPPDQAYEPGVQDPHRVVQCPTAPDHFWTQHHNGVFRSTDDCKQWHEITEPGVSGFGFGVAVHPRKPETAWFAPAIKDERRIPVNGQVVVTRTRDGGRSFDVLREGLPQEHAYDLVFRHALVVDDSGERLALGSTTGSLWISENQGDSWREISSHLPPIYCLRFA